jgi:cytoskeletal protein RodZ
MKTIGEAVKSARQKKRYSRARLEEATKIKKEFIEAIEKEDWLALPEYPVVQGFIKNISSVVKVDSRQMLALLRRDYPPKKLSVNPKPDVTDKFTWSPRLTFITGAILVTIAVLAYLGFQYVNFISPPQLTVTTPSEGQIVSERILKVIGKTDPQVVIKVNNQPVLISEEGDFSTEIDIFEGTKEIIIKAISRSGKETIIRRNIEPKLE